jgi:hypothetical protein
VVINALRKARETVDDKDSKRHRHENAAEDRHRCQRRSAVGLDKLRQERKEEIVNFGFRMLSRKALTTRRVAAVGAVVFSTTKAVLSRQVAYAEDRYATPAIQGLERDGTRVEDRRQPEDGGEEMSRIPAVHSSAANTLARRP